MATVDVSRSFRFALLVLAVAGCHGSADSSKDKAVDKTAAPQPHVATPAAAPKPIPPPAPPKPTTLVADPGGSTGKPLWQLGLGGLGTDNARDIASNAAGDAIVVGYTNETATFGALGQRTSNGGSDAFVLSINSEGTPTWVQTFGGPRDDTANAVAVAADGRIAVAGNFLDDMKVGNLTAKATGSDDLFVAQLDANGEPAWLWTAGGIDSDGANGIAATPDGGWVVVGSFSRDAKFGTFTLTSKGGTDAILIKLAAGGEVQWVKQFGGAYNETLLHVAVDGQGNIYAQGQFVDQVSFGGAVLKAGGGSDTDVVLAKYSPDGEHLWSQRFGNAFNDIAGGVVVDNAGNVTMTGSFDKSIVFGDGEFQALGEADIYVASFDSAGKLRWSHTWGGPREDIGYGIAVDGSGNIVVTGWFQDSVNFGGDTLKSNGNKDVFIVKLASTGAHLWSRSFGDHDHDQGRCVTIDSKGAITLAGTFRFALDLLTPPIDSVRQSTDRAPKADVFVAHLAR